ncbi:hypothetical protein GJ496_001811 [Pomphorhynchus laevis]|nr:hypothetical protein GJ496_001811 [Pomphorhynchus laevis]
MNDDCTFLREGTLSSGFDVKILLAASYGMSSITIESSNLYIIKNMGDDVYDNYDNNKRDDNDRDQHEITRKLSRRLQQRPKYREFYDCE